MRIINFAKRNFKEIIRDPLSIIFALLLPLFLLYIFQQFNIPEEAYKLENFTPGIIVFSYAFISMFTATLIAKDRSTSLLIRLSASPMKPFEYICGYALSVIPIVIFQNILFYSLAALLGLNISVDILFTILISLPLSLLFIFMGVLIGTIATDKSAPGVASIIVQLVVFTSGMYFSIDMVGEFFGLICKILPFSGSLDIIRGFLNHNYNGLLSPIILVVMYTIIIIIVSSILFKKKMQSDNKYN